MQYKMQVIEQIQIEYTSNTNSSSEDEISNDVSDEDMLEQKTKNRQREGEHCDIGLAQLTVKFEFHPCRKYCLKINIVKHAYQMEE